MKSLGLLGQVLVSHDAGWYDVQNPTGVTYRGYSTLFTNFIPALEDEGFSQAEIEQLIIENPRRAFSIQVRRVEPPPSYDADGDRLRDNDESRDLDPGTEGVQNPFDPDDPDSTGDNGAVGPDGILDGRNDWDGDAMTNADEFTWGFDPIDPASYGPVPTATWWGRTLLLASLLIAGLAQARRTVEPHATR
jgi:hypothetical protein